jgi:hypothetical protein
MPWPGLAIGSPGGASVPADAQDDTRPARRRPLRATPTNLVDDRPGSSWVPYARLIRFKVGEEEVTDVALLALTVALFALAFAFVAWIDRV